MPFAVTRLEILDRPHDHRLRRLVLGNFGGETEFLIEIPEAAAWILHGSFR